MVVVVTVVVVGVTVVAVIVLFGPDGASTVRFRGMGTGEMGTILEFWICG